MASTRICASTTGTSFRGSGGAATAASAAPTAITVSACASTVYSITGSLKAAALTEITREASVPLLERLLSRETRSVLNLFPASICDYKPSNGTGGGGDDAGKGPFSATAFISSLGRATSRGAAFQRICMTSAALAT